jgi:hypothetical protein
MSSNFWLVCTSQNIFLKLLSICRFAGLCRKQKTISHGRRASIGCSCVGQSSRTLWPHVALASDVMLIETAVADRVNYIEPPFTCS